MLPRVRQQRSTLDCSSQWWLVLFEYEHDDLNTGLGQEIRLVVLLPGESSVVIKIDIVHVTLRDTNFDTVSYTWATDDGDDEKSSITHHITGQILRVAINCEASLRQLRTRNLKRFLWIDAICINQSNVKERNHRVGIMDQIFSTAQYVIMSILCVSGFFGKESGSMYACCEPLFTWLHQPVEEVYFRHREWIEETLEALLQSRYFQRAWVIQEVAFARRLRLRRGTHEAELFLPILHKIRQYHSAPLALGWDPGVVCVADVMTCVHVLITVILKYQSLDILPYISVEDRPPLLQF